MPTTQYQVTVTISPAPPTVVKVTIPGETVGVAVTNVPVGQAPGNGPFTLSTDAQSPAPIPPGLSAAVDAQGNVTVSGTPTTEGTGTFWLDVASAS